MRGESEHPATSRKNCARLKCALRIAQVCVLLSGGIRQSRRTETSFSTLSDPPALTAPHCVQKNKFSWRVTEQAGG